MPANNTVSFIGRLTRDPDIREFGDDNKVANFSIAINRRTKADHPESDFFECEAWNGLAGVLESYAHKGSNVAIRCRAKQDKYVDKEGQNRTAIKFVVEDLQLLDRKSDSNSGSVAGSEDDDDFPI